MAQLTFFFDRNMGTRLPKALAQMNPPMRVVWHQEQNFKNDDPDDYWLAEVGKKRWVVVSQDRKWHDITTEAAAIRQHAVWCFYFPCASASRWVSLCHFIKRHERMMHLAETVPGPFVFRLAPNGQFYRVELP